MARKRAPGGGRKPRGEAPAVHFNTRISPEIRRRLERDAERNKRSLSREIELRLADSFAAAPQPDAHTKAFCYLLAQLALVARTAERTAGEPFDWRADRFDFEGFKSAVSRLLDALAPPGKPGDSRYASYRDPEDMGRTLAEIVLSNLRTGRAELAARGERRGALSGSLYYAFPQAAAALGVKASAG